MNWHLGVLVAFIMGQVYKEYWSSYDWVPRLCIIVVILLICNILEELLNK
jgi:hypothetical protein